MAPFRIVRPQELVIYGFEFGLVAAVVWGLATLTRQFAPAVAESTQHGSVALICLLFCGLMLFVQRAGLSDRGSARRELLLFTVLSALLGTVVFVATTVIRPGRPQFAAILALECAVAVPFVVALWRWISLRIAFLHARPERVLIVGTGDAAQGACRWIVTEHSRHYSVVGFADDDDRRVGTVLAMGIRIQTHYEALPSFCPERVDHVLVAIEEKRGHMPVQPLMALRLRGIEVEEATTFFERISGKIAVETMLPSWLIFSEGFKATPLRAAIKRVVDVTFSTTLVLLTAPLMLLCAIAIKVDSTGPVFYSQERLGRDGKPFRLHKFRSMMHRAERESGPIWTIANDPRITRVGRVLRKLRIDELPQLVNCLRGEMSFVGPRPEREHFIRQLEQRIPYYGLRMTARPGITGWAQVEYRYGATEADAFEKLKYDLYYIKNSNLLFDLWIVLKTVKVVLLGEGAR